MSEASIHADNALPLDGGGLSVRRLACVVLAVFLVLSLAGCGKKGNPQPPPDEPNTFPRTYPSE